MSSLRRRGDSGFLCRQDYCSGQSLAGLGRGSESLLFQLRQGRDQAGAGMSVRFYCHVLCVRLWLEEKREVRRRGEEMTIDERARKIVDMIELPKDNCSKVFELIAAELRAVQQESSNAKFDNISKEYFRLGLLRAAEIASAEANNPTYQSFTDLAESIRKEAESCA